MQPNGTATGNRYLRNGRFLFACRKTSFQGLLDMPLSSRSDLEFVRRTTTMAHVAQLAGVGKMTVSRFLSGSANVSKATADRVQRAIRMLISSLLRFRICPCGLGAA